MSDKAYRELAAQLVDLQKQFDGLSAAQLTRSSLEDGALRTYDGSGQLVGSYGRLPDGSYGAVSLSGPTPPTPSSPMVTVKRGIGLEIVWDGTFGESTEVVPLAGGRIEVYISVDSDITPAMVPRTTIESPRGGVVTLGVSYDQPYYVGFVFRAASGKPSAVSGVVGPVVVGRATKEDLEVDFDEVRGTKVFYGPDEPVTTYADLWLKTPDNTAWRFDVANDQWVQVRDQGIVQALVDAANANDVATQAGIDALAAQGAADNAGTAASGAQQSADDANAAASAAQLKANQAAQAAVDAAAAAQTAHQVADNAVAAAGTAQTAANTANTKALEAAGLAADKSKVYYQTSAPTPGDPLGLWIDTDDGFKPYRYVAGSWSYVENASVQAAATAAGNAQTTANTAKTTADTAVTNAATADAKAVQAAADAAAAATLAASKNKTFNQISQPTTGMVSGDQWLDTDDGNKRYVYTGTPLAWTASPLGASGISATARQLGSIVTYRQSAAPASGMIVGDFWIDSDDNKLYRWEGSTPAWVVVQDLAIQAAINSAATAQATADGKVRIFPQTTPPTGLLPVDVGDLWIDTDDSNVSYTWALISGTTYGWVKRQLGNGAITPNSLVASNVIATGTVSAGLLEALLILATEIIAGNPLGDHARMTPAGFRVYKADVIDGVPNEVVRMGTETNDYFGVVDSLGNLVASIDDTGQVNARRVVTGQLVVGGRDLMELIGDSPEGEVGRFSQRPSADIGPLWDVYGIAEVGALLMKGRAYRVDWRASFKVQTGGDEVIFRLRSTGGPDGNYLQEAPAPTVTSTEFGVHRATGERANYWYTVTGSTQFYPGLSSRHRILLTAQRGPAGTSFDPFWVTTDPVEIMVTDLGPAGPVSGGFNAGNGKKSGSSTVVPPPASTSQQYFVDLAPLGWASYRGDGSQRPLEDGIVQGYDPSGFNGNGGGFWWFDVPSITGNVDRVDFYAYTEHWYYNSGGEALLAPIPGGINNNFEGWKLKPNWVVPGWPKPGGKTVTVPADWFPLFKNAVGRAIGISVGRGNGTNLIHYGRFQGGSARLRLWYTQ